MAIFFNYDESRVCLISSGFSYHLVLKSLKKPSNECERIMFRRDPIIECEDIDAFIQHRAKRLVKFASAITLCDFSKYQPIERSHVGCLPGSYLLDCLTILWQGRTSNVAVLRATSIGISEEGLETALRRQEYEIGQERKQKRVLAFVALHLGVSVKQLDLDYELQYVNGLGAKIGSGPYRAWIIIPKQKPAVIKAGITIREIVDQL